MLGRLGRRQTPAGLPALLDALRSPLVAVHTEIEHVQVVESSKTSIAQGFGGKGRGKGGKRSCESSCEQGCMQNILAP